MTSLTVRRENLFAAITRRKFGLLLLSLRSAAFLRGRRSAHRIQTVTGKTSRVAAEVSTARKNRETINSDQPNRERLEADARLAFFALDRGVHFMNVRRFAVIHSLTGQRS